MSIEHESRAAMPGIGKCTEEIKTVLPEQVRDELVALAVINHQKPAEYLRDLIIEHLYGSLNATRLRAARRNGMADSGRAGGES